MTSHLNESEWREAMSVPTAVQYNGRRVCNASLAELRWREPQAILLASSRHMHVVRVTSSASSLSSR